MSFTPGPWFADDHQIFDDNGNRIAVCNGHTRPDDEREWGQWKANAHRIVTAVNAFDDMKAALTDALRSTRKDFKAGPDGDRQHREAYAEQFAALSKAEGHIGQELAPDPERRVDGDANGGEK